MLLGCQRMDDLVLGQKMLALPHKLSPLISQHRPWSSVASKDPLQESPSRVLGGFRWKRNQLYLLSKVLHADHHPLVPSCEFFQRASEVYPPLVPCACIVMHDGPPNRYNNPRYIAKLHALP